MDLKTYMHQLDGTGQETFAKNVSTTVGHLRNIYLGLRQAGESLAISIDRETSGAVTCEELRPDVDWAYLRGSKRKQPQGA